MNSALTEAVEDLALPEHMVRALIADYMDFLAKQAPAAAARLDERLSAEDGLHDRIYFEAQGSILAATLMMTLESDADIDELLETAYGRQLDPDLLAMRKELVSRSLAQNKGTPAKAGLSKGLVAARKRKFCQEADELEGSI